jgi:uncharacterized protein
MIENLNQAQISGILEALPVEITFTDENDVVKYWNKHDDRMFKRPMTALGKDVRRCHSAKSIDQVCELLTDFKNNKKDRLEYTENSKGKTIYVKYIAVRDKDKKFLGVLEIVQDITDIMKFKG